MFSEIEVLVTDLRAKVSTLQLAITHGGDYFHALALASCYNEMIRFADERTQSHPEVQRVPALRTLLLAHFLENADRHIDLRADRIFYPALLGGPQTVRDWQESGYYTKRSQSNYPARLRYWRALYDSAPILFQQRVVNQSDNLFSSSSVYQSTFISPKNKIPKRPEISYEEVIAKRNRRYSATESLVPWWQLLNYGTSLGGVTGYPSVAGLHFVEDAERLVPTRVDQYLQLFERFIGDVFDEERTTGDAILLVEQWAHRNVQVHQEYIPLFDIARIITFGVPF